jgi:uncharacterized iron-regulated protein
MDTLIPQLLDFGALGMFAGFLIWLNARSQKRLDEMVDQFQKTLKEQEAAHGEAEEIIRSRYDTIIGQYNTERATIYQDLVQTLAEVKGRVDDLHSRGDGG